MTEAYTLQNWKLRLTQHPVEDFYSYDGEKGIYIVADGVTRDPSQILPDVSTLRGKLDFLRAYPKESEAAAASQAFCKRTLEVLRSYEGREKSELIEAFIQGNHAIGELNKGKEIDYTVNDFAGCVAAIACLNRDFVSWAFISDCGVAVFDSDGRLRARTQDFGPSRYNDKFLEDPRIKNSTWEDPEVRRIIRKEYRNNLNNPSAYGVLTGESQAIYYVKTGSADLAQGDSVITYSDGLEKTIFTALPQLLARRKFRAIKRACQREVHSEGTLIIS